MQQLRRPGFNPWVRKISWRRKCNPLPYSYLENPMDGGVWWATVHGVAKSQTRLSTRAHTHTHTHKLSVNKCVSFWCFILHLNDILKALGIWQLSESSRFLNQGKLTIPKISLSQIFEVQHTSGW